MTIKEEKKLCIAEINKIDNKLNILLEKIEKLKSEETVKEYLELNGHIIRCVESRNNLYKKYQRLLLEDCDHPIWYYNDVEKMPNNKDKLVKCTCLVCGREKFAKESFFKGRIIGIKKKNMMSYKEARKCYLEYKTNCSEDKKAKRFIKKFFPD